MLKEKLFISLWIYFLLIHSIKSYRYFCDYDFNDYCIQGLNKFQPFPLNETTNPLKQPTSDVSSIETSNDKGECQFPFVYSGLNLYFCVQTMEQNNSLTCQNKEMNSKSLICNQGSYGFIEFNDQIKLKSSHLLNLNENIHQGIYCFRFYYYFSTIQSNGSIEIIVEDIDNRMNQSIIYIENSSNFYQWNEIRKTFQIDSSISKIYFVFHRSTSQQNPFVIAIDQIDIFDLPCEPMRSTTTTTSTISSSSVTTTTTMDKSSSRKSMIYWKNLILSMVFGLFIIIH